MENEDLTIVHQHATITALRDRVAEVERERDAVLEDRARFPNKPDTIGSMIEAHICNLKAGKESSDRFANQWHARMIAAEARATAAEAQVARMQGVLRMLLCIEFDHFTDHDELLLESVIEDARALTQEPHE